MQKCIAALRNERSFFGHMRTIWTSTVDEDQQVLKRKTQMNLVRSYNNWRRYRETVAELGKLSSRELNDLGINRSDIPFVARKAAA